MIRLAKRGAVILLMCTAAAGAAAEGFKGSAVSDRSAKELASCIEQKINYARSYDIEQHTRQQAREIAIVARYTGIPTVLGSLIISQEGTHRLLSAYTTNDAGSAPEALVVSALSCAVA